MERRHRRGGVSLAFVALIFLLLAGTVVRVRHITSIPGWFRDEGTYMEAAWNAARGEARIGPLNHTWVSPFQTKPPLHALTSGAWMHVIGAVRGDQRPNIQVFRWFSALCGLLVILGVHRLGWAFGPPPLALLATALVTFEPWTVMFNRMGLPHNLLAVEFMAVFLLAHRYFEKPSVGRLAATAAVAATAPLTAYYGLALPIALCVAVALMGRRRDLWLAPLALLPFALFIAGLWWVRPLGLEADWAQFRLNATGTWDPRDWLRDARDLLTVSPLIVLGLIGLALLPRRGIRPLIQITVALYLFLWLRLPHNQVWLRDPHLDIHLPLLVYPLIPLLPLIVLGAVQTLITAWLNVRAPAEAPPVPWKRLRTTIAVIGLVAALALTLAASSSFPLLRGLRPRAEETPPDRWIYTSALAYHLAILKSEALGSPETGPGVSPFLWDQGVADDDLVIAEYPLWWTLPGRPATLTQSVAYLGGGADFFVYPVARERFAYSCDWRTARFIVLDLVTRRDRAWPGSAVKPIVEEIESDWEEVFRAGRLIVYAPPRVVSPEVTAPSNPN